MSSLAYMCMGCVCQWLLHKVYIITVPPNNRIIRVWDTAVSARISSAASNSFCICFVANVVCFQSFLVRATNAARTAHTLAEPRKIRITRRHSLVGGERLAILLREIDSQVYESDVDDNKQICSRVKVSGTCVRQQNCICVYV